MLYLPRSRRLNLLTVVVFALLICVIGACAFFDINTFQDVRGYIEMRRGFHPVWKDLALRRVDTGDGTGNFLRKHPPPLVVEYGPFTDYEYEIPPRGYISFNTLRVTAIDGRLISARAGSCTWRHTFFADRLESDRAILALLDGSTEKRYAFADAHSDSD